jgi:hypothetical protein
MERSSPFARSHAMCRSNWAMLLFEMSVMVIKQREMKQEEENASELTELAFQRDP